MQLMTIKEQVEERQKHFISLNYHHNVLQLYRALLQSQLQPASLQWSGHWRSDGQLWI